LNDRIMVSPKKLSNLQLELLKTFQIDLSDEQLLEIKEILSKYFSEKATLEMDKVWDNQNWDDDTIEQLANTHTRISTKK